MKLTFSKVLAAGALLGAGAAAVSICPFFAIPIKGVTVSTIATMLKKD